MTSGIDISVNSKLTIPFWTICFKNFIHVLNLERVKTSVEQDRLSKKGLPEDLRKELFDEEEGERDSSSSQQEVPSVDN